MTTLPSDINSRIAIVGAGPAGVHMAYSLKKKGYSDVVIYEKSDRVGGKTYSKIHDDIAHELGTTAFAMTKGSPLESFIASVFPDIESHTYKLNIMTLAKNALIRKHKNKKKSSLLVKIARVMFYRRRFYRVYNRLIKKGYPYNITKDDHETLTMLACSMKTFLISNGMEFIYRSLNSRFIAYGYGRLENIPAYYGIMVLERNYLSKSTYRAFNQGNDFLWKETVRKFDLKTELEVSVTGIDYSKYQSSGKISLHLEKNSNKVTETFDFIVLTAPYLLADSLPSTIAPEFKKINSLSYASSLIDMGVRDSADKFYTGEYPAQALNTYNYDVVLAAHFGKMKEVSSKKYKSNSNAFICFQLNDQPDNSFNVVDVSRKLEEQIKKKFDRKGGLDKVHKLHCWQHYSPYFQNTCIEQGIIKKIEAEQGKHGIWYTGSCISGELVSLVCEYNDFLLNLNSDNHLTN